MIEKVILMSEFPRLNKILLTLSAKDQWTSLTQVRVARDSIIQGRISAGGTVHHIDASPYPGISNSEMFWSVQEGGYLYVPCFEAGTRLRLIGSQTNVDNFIDTLRTSQSDVVEITGIRGLTPSQEIRYVSTLRMYTPVEWIVVLDLSGQVRPTTGDYVYGSPFIRSNGLDFGLIAPNYLQRTNVTPSTIIYAQTDIIPSDAICQVKTGRNHSSGVGTPNQLIIRLLY